MEYVVIYCDNVGKCTGYYIKKNYTEAKKFAELVSSNGWTVKIYEDIPIDIYEPKRIDNEPGIKSCG